MIIWFRNEERGLICNSSTISLYTLWPLLSHFLYWSFFNIFLDVRYSMKCRYSMWFLKRRFLHRIRVSSLWLHDLWKRCLDMKNSNKLWKILLIIQTVLNVTKQIQNLKASSLFKPFSTVVYMYVLWRRVYFFTRVEIERGKGWATIDEGKMTKR